MSGENGAGVSPEVLDYIREQNTVTLATASSAGVPRATTLRYASDGLTLYVWMRAEATAAQQITQNPQVSFAIHSEGKGLQGTGEGRIVLGGDEVARAVKLFAEKYAGLSGSGSTANISFFRISPMSVKLVDEGYAGGRGETQMVDVQYRQEVVYDVFRDLPGQAAAAITGHLKRVDVKAGDVVARQGTPADKLLVVVDGELEVTRDEAPAEEGARTLRPGDFFGDVAIMRDKPRAATIRAVSDATLLAMDREDFRALLAQSLGAPENFDELLSARLGRIAGGDGP